MRNSSNRSRYKTVRYRFATSVAFGVGAALGLLYLSTQHGSGDKIPTRALLGGDLAAGVFVAVGMFVVWSVGAMYRAAGRRARERERAAAAPPPGRGRGRRYAGNPR